MDIRFEQFSYIYPGSTAKALDTITLHIPSGTYTVITGLSGAGKSSLCLAIAGAIPQYFGGQLAGTVLVGGEETTRLTIADLAYKVGTVLADYETQLVTMTVAEEVAFGLENRGISPADIRKKTRDMLALVGLEDMEQAEVAHLSGGQKQRLVLAGVLATDPDILVLDEPASALDPEGAEDLYRLLAALNSDHGKTIVIVEHDLARVLPYAHQLILMETGRIACTGTMADTLSYMYKYNSYTEALPPLWQLKFDIENKSQVLLGDWLDENDAVKHLCPLMDAGRKDDSQSA